MQVAVVLSQYRHIYNRAAGEVIGYLLKASETDQSIPAQCTVHVCTFQRETQQSVVICRGDRCRLSLFKESLSNPACGYMKQRRPSRLGSKLFRGAAISHTMTTCTRRVGRSRVSRPVLLLAATSGFNEVIEFGSFLSQFASLLLATNTSL